jgi:hypothetical protein
MKFKQLGLVGCGLMGASFALALQDKALVDRVVGFSPSEGTRQKALQRGVIHQAAASAAQAVQGADLVLIAVPVSHTATCLREIAPYLHKDCLLMDVGSTKGDVVAVARAALGDRLGCFLPAHPIAGKAQAGVDHAESSLYQDRALILTMASTGARRREISHLLLANLDLAERSIRLEVTKNGDPRDAFLHPTAATSLTEWLDVRGLSPGPLLVALSRTGRPLLDRKLSEHQMWKIVRRRSEECGIGAVTPHDMRRFVVTRLLEEGHDLLLVSRLVGHSNPSVTKLYDRRPIDSFRAAIATLPLGSLQVG